MFKQPVGGICMYGRPSAVGERRELLTFRYNVSSFRGISFFSGWRVLRRLKKAIKMDKWCSCRRALPEQSPRRRPRRCTPGVRHRREIKQASQ